MVPIFYFPLVTIYMESRDALLNIKEEKPW